MGLREQLGIETDEAANGRALAFMVAGDDHLNDAGTVHGGAIATLADSVMGSAVLSTLDDHVPVTVEASIRFLEPGRKGKIVGKAKVRRPGKKFIVVEAELTQDESNEHIAFATATFTAVGE
ncbi:MAG: PaaI family thioesterase [Actinomycetota bacterium]|nr:PaaI family thioesterase [Actinomycetota bacterium]